MGPHPGRRHRGRRRVAGDHPHRGRHRAAAHGRAAAVGGHPRRPHRAAQPHRAASHRVDALLAEAAVGEVARAVHRPRQLQGGQRQPRPRHRRHAADGDVGAAARRSSAPDAVLARFGGDEFIVVLHDAGATGRPSPSPRRCARRCATPVDVEGTELFVTASIGVLGQRPRPAMSAADLLRDADAAMYRAKARGRDCVEAFAAGHARDDGARRCARRPSCGAASSGARSCRTSSRSSS